jgi:hypothetical protein
MNEQGRSDGTRAGRSAADVAAACLTAGLLTAWGGEPAEAAPVVLGDRPYDMYYRVAVQPVLPIARPYFLYYPGGTGLQFPVLWKLQDAPFDAGKTYQFDVPLEYVRPLTGKPATGGSYTLLGVHPATTPGLVAGISDTYPISGRNFDDSLVFSTPRDLTRAQLLTALAADDTASLKRFMTTIGSSVASPSFGPSLPPPGRLVRFDRGTDVGTISVTVVPEPAGAWVLAGVGACAVVLGRGRRRVVGAP